ncbi:hypothetical protein SAMN02983003_4037 [Devosia enhydra]|uniref:DUF6644 domain-containing protein n=1 Tax=Devosia enhydra TaxID=665118 RepID=A0A1K2I373_9HYPH|nr:DUF6644 family protein [Devosia enhydra]SFZ86842.1 hypothetical protein SAMN02983003_4037 [Devosia enhydra]
MDLSSFFSALENSALSQFVNTFGPTYPIVESVHVIAIALVFGTILIVDLRLLGVASTNRPFTRVAHDLLKLTWGGFVLAVITGILLFLPNATSIYININFQIKMILLIAAGLNMLVFELVTARGVSVWDRTAPPNSARLAGLLSIGLWMGVIVFGRLIGFTSVADDPFAFL